MSQEPNSPAGVGEAAEDDLFASLGRLLSASAVYAIAAFVQRGLSFLLLPIYTRFIEPSEFGLLELITALFSLLFGLLALGMPSAVIKCFHRDCDSSEARRSLLTNALGLALPTLAVGGLVCALFATPISIWLLGEARPSLIMLASGNGIAAGVVAVALASLRARERAISFSTLTLLQFLLAITLNIYLVVSLELGIQGVLIGNLVSNVVAAPIALAVTYRGGLVRFDSRLVKSLFYFGLVLLPSFLAEWLIELSDRYILSMFRDASEVAVYGVGYKIGMLVHVAVVWPFQLAWPAASFSASNEPGHEQTFARTLSYLAATLAYGVVGLALTARAVVPIIVGPGYQEAFRVVLWVALGYAFYGIMFCQASGLHLAGKTKFLSLFVWIAATLNVGLNVLLADDYGMIGAAVATTISYAALAGMTSWMSQRVYPVPIESRRLLKIAVSVPLVLAIAHLTRTVLPTTVTAFSDVAFGVLGIPGVLLLIGAIGAEETKALRRLLSTISRRRS